MLVSKRNCILFVVLLVLMNVSYSNAYSNAIIINEILALNEKQMSDPAEPGEFPDWIELYNSSENEVNLGNMYFSDNKDNLTKWKIPENIKIAGHGFSLFFADNDVEQGPNHTNFKLAGAGEIVVLIDTDGKTIIDSLSYGIQTNDVSYGRFPDGSDTFNFFDTPTPGQKNINGYIDNVANVQFDYQRGFYDHPFMLTLSTSPASAKIYYTIDGSEPLNEAGDDTFLYLSPISIDKTTCVRAKATLSGWKTSDIVTHTYIFLDNVLRQPARPDGFPTNWGHTGTGDYEMDPDVVDDPKYSSTIKDDMKAIPTVSLVMDVDDWFGENGQGIYLEGELDERAVSAELIHPDGTPGFQINCAVMIVGGSSVNRWKSDKLSMRLKFQKSYGPASLKYPLFGEEATDKFDTIVLDARLNNSWAYGGGSGIVGRSLTQRDVAQYTRDQFVADIQNELGGYAPHGRHVHLYLNGLYWGLYWLHERPDEHFAVAYFGGDEDDYDVIKHNSNTIVHGSNQNYLQMFSLARNGLSTDAQFSSIQQLLDIPNFIDYMIINFYVGNTDWAHQNWYASRHRTDPSHLWRYHSWDAEHVITGLNVDVTDKNNDGGPTFLHQKLSENAEYRMMIADHVYQLFFNNGVLTPARIKELYQIRLNDIDRAVVGESARWGDNRRDVPYTRDVEWVAERDWILNTYLEQRTEIVLEQIKQKGLYPPIDPPVYYINNTEHNGGKINKGDKLVMDALNSTIYYTIDGTDPLGIENPQEGNSTILVAENAEKRVFVPKSSINSNWKVNQDFDDSSWDLCQGDPGGIGYEKNSGYEHLISLDVGNDMHNDGGNPNPSCFIRVKFNTSASSISTFKRMMLNIRYDDGFIAYLNGEKIAEANVPESPLWNSTANGNHEATAVETFDISESISYLSDGSNLLAIHGMNVNTSSSDFIITVELFASDEAAGDNIASGAIKYDNPIELNETVKIKARATRNNRWSALHEADFLIPENLSDLKITEIHYHPLAEGNVDDREFEFIELKNVGTSVLNLSLCQFIDGVSYTFPSNTKLNAGGYIVLASNNEYFKQRYSQSAFGQFTGNLDNAGEKLVLIDALNDTLISLRYNDKSPWPSKADGDGYSLTSKNSNPQGDPNNASYWICSSQIHGSPGGEDPILGIEQNHYNSIKEFSLQQNYPNPFNPVTKITYTLKKAAEVKLELFNVTGRLVATLANGLQTAGRHEVTFDAKGLAGGIYFYRLQTAFFTETKRMLLLK